MQHLIKFETPLQADMSVYWRIFNKYQTRHQIPFTNFYEVRQPFQ